jgi:plasmid stabilization system protein ParE
VKLRYTRPALADFNSVLDYIAAHSPQGARRIQARIQALIDLLLLYPGIGTRTGDPTIRRMTALSYQYVIFYEATEIEIIIIHAVRHAARDPSSMPGAS